MYKLNSYQIAGAQFEGLVRIADNAFIPFDPANTDYQKYLEWLAEGNAPLPPEENLNGN